MTSQTDEAFHLLRDVRRQKTELDLIERRLLTALGVRKPKPVYERAVEWLLAVLVEKPVERFVDVTLQRLDKWRSRRNPSKF